MDVSVTNIALGLDVPDASKKINSPTAARGVGRVRSVASVDPFSVSGYLFREFAFSGSRNRSTSPFTLLEADTSKNMTMNLGEFLVGQGLVTRADIDAARERQLVEGGRSGDNLIALALVTEISS
jgi:hypothetical protein